jgi:DNA-binding GntR family transcriptional regulator
MKVRSHLLKREPGRSRRNGVMTGEVAKVLRRAIFQGEFQPGDPLPEAHLARRCGVSQAVVREALAALAHAGLIRRFPNKGSFVTSLTPVEIAEHVRLRLMLETRAWLDVAEHAHPAAYGALEEKLGAIGAAVTSGDYFEIAQSDLEFHRQIWRLSGDSTLTKLLDQIVVPLFAFVSVRRSQRHDDLSHMVAEHAEIVEVLRRGDVPRLLTLVRCQVERSYAGFVAPAMASAVFPAAAEPAISLKE